MPTASLTAFMVLLQPCNPAVGGPAKSQLVHEVDALGGEIGKMADRTYVQKRVLNKSKVDLLTQCLTSSVSHIAGAGPRAFLSC